MLTFALQSPDPRQFYSDYFNLLKDEKASSLSSNLSEAMRTELGDGTLPKKR